MNLLPWQSDVWQSFAERLTAGRLAHALLIQGQAGIGKLRLARAMAAALLCTANGTAACGACRSCMLLKSGAHPDWFPLTPEEGKHQILIDPVRDVIAALTFTTTISSRKVALIHPAEAMNINAANALLKCLEEPPGDTVMLLVSHDPARLPVTIRSRCQSIAVAVPDDATALAWLREECGLDATAANAALAAGGGSPCRAAQLAASGQVEGHLVLQRSLARLLQHPQRVSRAASELGELDQDALWHWLSTASADALRCTASGAVPAWLNGTAPLDCRKLSRLQQHADRNRRLAETAVRQDLLLQEWLIEWAALTH